MVQKKEYTGGKYYRAMFAKRLSARGSGVPVDFFAPIFTDPENGDKIKSIFEDAQRRYDEKMELKNGYSPEGEILNAIKTMAYSSAKNAAILRELQVEISELKKKIDQL